MPRVKFSVSKPWQGGLHQKPAIESVAGETMVVPQWLADRAEAKGEGEIVKGKTGPKDKAEAPVPSKRKRAAAKSKKKGAKK